MGSDVLNACYIIASEYCGAGFRLDLKYHREVTASDTQESYPRVTLLAVTRPYNRHECSVSAVQFMFNLFNVHLTQITLSIQFVKRFSDGRQWFNDFWFTTGTQRKSLTSF